MLCGPCKAQGKKEAAVVYCKECENELLCVECKTRHSIQIITKKHVLQALEIEEDMPTNASDEDRELFCDQCKAMNRTSIASVFCSDCENQLLCAVCEDYHRSLKITQEHKLQNVSYNGNITEGSSSKAVTVRSELKQNTKYKPGRPSAISVSFDSIKLQWSTPKALSDGDYFQLCYKEHNSPHWKTWEEMNTESVKNITHLKSETQYIFRVRVIHNDVEGPFSDVSESVKTVQSAASILVKCSSCPGETNTTPKQFSLPMEQKERDPITKIRSFQLGEPGSCIEKTIMLVGETGTGKSTLVDGMANYILGVGWDDPFRFKMVSLESEEKGKSTNQAVSQTEWITCYKIHPMNGGRLKYSITIIDTPGFGDTRGIEHDQKIVKQIDKLFSSTPPQGVLNVEAICFLVKAPDGRLTTSQNYIFNSIMSIFGKDIEENICSLITFADGNEPCVLAALVESGMPFGQHFMFNNSALFAKNTNTDYSGVSSKFWEMGIQSFQKFFRYLESIPTKSLQLTTDVLYERNRLEINISNFEATITAAVIKVQELKSEIDCLNKYRDIIEQNKQNKQYKFTTKQLCIKKEKLPSGENVTNCTHCHSTCHPKCKRAKSSNKKGCWAMDKSGKCRICPNNCKWNVHVNETYRYIYTEEEVETTYDEIKQKIENATGKALNKEEMISNKRREVLDLHVQMKEMMNIVRNCNMRLAKIALRPNPLSEEEYIDKLIANERFENRTGSLQRIETLNQFKKRAKVPEMYQTLCNETAPVLFEVDNTMAKKHVTKRFYEYIKTPTCLLIQPNGNTVEAFGTDAVIRYTELAKEAENTDWYFFRRFKMQLYDSKRSIGPSTMLTDETGKELHALKVYSLSIKYMKDNFYDFLNSITDVHTFDIHWVLTVPDIWNESAKQFMIMSAQEAGIEIEHLSIASEPEAVCTYSLFTESIYNGPKMSHITTFHTGQRYLVCDIGGDTAYITVHKVTLDMKLKQIEAVAGGECVVTKAHEEFEKYMDTLAGCHVMKASKNKHMDDYIELMNTFDLKKKTFTKSTSAGTLTFCFPFTIRTLVEQMTGKTFEEQVQRSKYGKTTTVKGNKITCSESDLSALFDEPKRLIIRQLTAIVSKYIDDPINHIIMNGGFSESLLLQNALREAFPSIKVTVPIDDDHAVLSGSVILGHNGFQIISRVA